MDRQMIALALALTSIACATVGSLALAQESKTAPASAPAPAQPPAAKAQAAKPERGPGDFAEARTGEVPDGALALITPETDKAIRKGLDWLAKQQQKDGSFGSMSYRGNLAVTSLSGVAFMCNGSTPGRGPYGDEIDKALGYVLGHVTPSGFIVLPNSLTHGPMYSHGFATMFLAEAYGMSHRAELHEKLQSAVRLIIDTQNPEGGWRYQPQPNDADISVTVCQINALRAARNAGIFVPKETVDRCIKYCKQAQNPDGGFRYMLQGGGSAFPRSAAGLVAMYSAAVYDEKELDLGFKYLFNSLPNGKNGLASRGMSHYFYGHYYAAQAMWIRGGKDWETWYPAIRDELINKQSADGSWNDSICREYGSAMALIVLQMPNNYVPIFQR